MEMKSDAHQMQPNFFEGLNSLVNVFLPGWRNFPCASADESSRVAWSENLEGKMFKLRMRNLSLKTKKVALETVIVG